jgi:MFS family permease
MPHLEALRALTPDGRLLFATRCARLFAYGMLSVVLVLYLKAVGQSEERIGLLLMLTLLGDTVISLWLTTTANRFGRRRTLIAGALLMTLAGVVFAATDEFWLLLLAATVGVISPSGNEVGPFLSVEQAALAQTVPNERRTEVFAWYNLVGSLATALGALCGGAMTQWLQNLEGFSGADSYRPLAVGYALVGVLLAILFTRLSPAAEAPPAVRAHTPGEEMRLRFGLHRSFWVVGKLSCLFALDAFGGGFVVQSIVAYWFIQRFGEDVNLATVGAIFFAANLVAGLSGLAAAWVARRIGLLNTMIVTHLPSNVLLLLVPLMPTLELAVLVLLLRFSISQMDVPTRQSYTVAVVDPDERSAAAGVTGVARSVGAAVSPTLAMLLLANQALLGMPFFLAGGIKILYDLLLYRSFAAVRPEEERKG